jgi:hypothetical protein
MTKLIVAFHNFANAPKHDWMIGPVWTVMRGLENILQLGSWTLECWLVGLMFARAVVGFTGTRYWYFFHCAWTVRYSSSSRLTRHGLDDPESISDRCRDFYLSPSRSYWGHTPSGGHFSRFSQQRGRSLSSNAVELYGKCPVLIAASIWAYSDIFFQFLQANTEIVSRLD